MRLADILGGIIVSVQTHGISPLGDSETIAKLAKAAEQGGALAIRAEGVADIRAISRVCKIPIIGLKKDPPLTPERVYITQNFTDAVEIAEAGASIIALDGTARERPGGETLPSVIARIHQELGLSVMADVDGADSAKYAAKCGADILGSTLVGYTLASRDNASDTINLDVLQKISKAVSLPVLAEGRIWTREDALAARLAGASGVVVGSAITDPILTTRRYARALANYSPDRLTE